MVFCGFCWPLLGKSWDHIGLILGHFGLRWDILGNVGTLLGSCWAILVVFCGLWDVGTFWATLAPYLANVGAIFLARVGNHIRLILGHFGLCWDILGHVGTILGSCCSILRYFRICVGLCFGLGHSVSLNFRPCKAFAQNTQNTRKKYNLWTAWLMVFAAIFFVFVSFLGHAAVRLCLPDLGLMLGHCGLCRHHIGLMLGHYSGILWFVLAFVRQELVRLILGHFRLCWDILGHIGIILGSCWAILGYFGICVGLCLGFGHFSVVEFSSMQRVCKKYHKYQGRNTILGSC